MAAAEHTDPEAPVLVLFRSDLRLSDNLALNAARASGKPVVAAFIRDEGNRGPRLAGGARRWWLHHSLAALTASLARKKVDLVLRTGRADEVVEALIGETGAGMVVWNRRYDPPSRDADAALKGRLRERGIRAESFEGHLLHEPGRLATGSGGHYRVYTPFWRALSGLGEPREPVPAPAALKPFAGTPRSERLADWNLLPTKPDWAGGLADEWEPGEAGAGKRLEGFLHCAIDGYGDHRDVPGITGTSRLSPHLAHGEITPFQIWHALSTRKFEAPAADVEKFRKEVAWREFSYHLLFHNPDLARQNFNGRFDDFPWRDDSKGLAAWHRGETGYPIVDAGMRELWQTGWMHNRVRMIAASFLIKHLLVDWRTGEDWFWDTLVDADPANNAASWQWVAGSGADAAPYFRIFNPILQGEKFDPEGRYVRRFVPELAKVPDRWLHRPWEAPDDVMAAAGVKLGKDYPVPVVDHQAARDRAMKAYNSTRGE
jgi:deoxyribodipyrimidine photo-lyase